MASFVAVLTLVASTAEASTLRGHEEYLRDCSACHGAARPAQWSSKGGV